MLGHTNQSTFADSTRTPRPIKMNIDFLVSTEVDQERSESTVENPPYADKELSIRGPRPPARAQSYPQGVNSFPNQPLQIAPLYLEPTTQPYWVQDAGAGSQSSLTRSRLSSVSSVATSGDESRRHKRAARPKYDPEMAYFIWFHRSDLGLPWDDVKKAFNKQFPQNQTQNQNQARAIAGIQSKFYRVLKDHGVPMIRTQRRGRNSSRDAYHDIKFSEWIPGAHYAWMDNRLPRIQHIRDLPTAAAATTSQPRSRL